MDNHNRRERRRLRLETRTRLIETAISTARLVARATGHHVVDGYPAYVQDTASNKAHAIAGTYNYAGGAGFARS